MPSIKEIWRDHIMKNKTLSDATALRRSPRLLAKRRAERTTAPGNNSPPSTSSYCPAFHRHLSPTCPAPIRNIPNSIELDENDALETEKTALWGVIGVTGIITSHGDLYPLATFLNMPRRIYDHRASRWARYPRMARTLPEGQREYQVATFLNEICDYYRKVMAREGAALPRKERRWYTTRSKRRLTDGKYAPVYGVVLTEAGSDVLWGNILCDVQVADTADLMPDVVRRLSRSAANVFATQDDCIYHVGIAFAGDDFSVVVHDRAGRVQSLVYKVHQQAGILVGVLCSLSLLDGLPLGRDFTMELREDGTRVITVDEVEYQVQERLFLSNRLRGCGTRCWRCRRTGSEENYIVKSTWIGAKRSTTEVTFLNLAGDIDGLPSLLSHEVVSDGTGKPLSTDLFRRALRDQGRGDELEPVGCMHLHRLVTQPYARPLCDFSSKEELLTAIHDAVAAHYALYMQKRILHCDISEQNVMLRPKDADERIRRGLLIDLDCATFVGGPLSTGPIGYRAGTVPFMSTSLLMQPRAPHIAAHDLESFLYVLMWVCASYAGPSCTRRRGHDWRNTPMSRWVEGDPKEIGNRKWTDVYAKPRTDFRAFLDENFHPYFDDLKDCVCELRQAILLNDTLVTHEEVLEILAKHIRAQRPPELQYARESSPPIVEGPLAGSNGASGRSVVLAADDRSTVSSRGQVSEPGRIPASLDEFSRESANHDPDFSNGTSRNKRRCTEATTSRDAKRRRLGT
ncbi:hypothetical protein GGG16DRAFT_115071 [Schizophyllum commune]